MVTCRDEFTYVYMVLPYTNWYTGDDKGLPRVYQQLSRCCIVLLMSFRSLLAFTKNDAGTVAKQLLILQHCVRFSKLIGEEHITSAKRTHATYRFGIIKH